MDARIMRTLAELIAEHHRQKGQDCTTDQYSAFDTTVSHDEENPPGVPITKQRVGAQHKCRPQE
jgi:hypothetical protein